MCGVGAPTGVACDGGPSRHGFTSSIRFLAVTLRVTALRPQPNYPTGIPPQ